MPLLNREVGPGYGADSCYGGKRRLGRRVRVSPIPAARSALFKQENRGTIMAVLTASQTGTPAVEAPAGEFDVMKPGEYGQLWYAPSLRSGSRRRPSLRLGQHVGG